VNDLLSTLSHTPLPTILVVAGIMFWILAIAGSVAGKITVEPGKQETAGLVGTAFIALGLILIFAPGPANQSEPAATTKTTQTPEPRPAQTTGPPTVEKKAELPPPAKSDPTSTRPSPGVDCTGKGTPDEVAICGNAKLKDLDWELYGVYQALMQRSDKSRQAKLASEESAWVRKRGECQSDERCITTAYKSRIDQLQSMQ
jgi:uncharacterized protein YecT (DUF1311 family)